MKNILIIVVLMLSPLALAEESFVNHQKSNVPAESRFEFVQSTLAARGTFKIDKYSGSVFQIVQTKEDTTAWQDIPKYPHLLDKKIEGKVNYQIFVSGIAMKFTFLINVNTGATWQLVETKEKDLVWEPIP